VKPGGPLVILYADDLAATQARLEAAGARIVKDTFSFPGGRRFHFQDPDGYELAVWSDE
jgi:predicted enzyme related to lactoylglutathione lyase